MYSTFKFNIGLNNNPFSAKEIEEQLKLQFGATHFHVVDSEWDGKSEPTLVFTVQAFGWAWVNLLAQALCLRYKQTAIAFKGMESGYGTLTYVHGWQGEMGEFSDEYFVD